MHVIPGIDEIDNQILLLLKENARYTYSDIADKIGTISRVAVKNRVEKLEKAGSIQGYTVKLAPRAHYDVVEFIVEVEPSPAQWDYCLDVIARTDWVRKVMATTGKAHIIATGLAPNMKEVDTVYTKLHNIFSSARYFDFQIIASTYKDVDGGKEYVKPNCEGESEQT